RGDRRVHQVAARRRAAIGRAAPAARRHAPRAARRGGAGRERPATPPGGPMTTAVFAPEAREERPSYISIARTVQSWLFTTDHKRIALLYLASVTFFLLVGGLFAMLIRIEHLTPDRTIVDAQTYNRLFTMHGITMVWLFMIPSIPTVFGNFLLP